MNRLDEYIRKMYSLKYFIRGFLRKKYCYRNSCFNVWWYFIGGLVDASERREKLKTFNQEKFFEAQCYTCLR